MKSHIFWDIKLCSPLKVNQILKEHVASIFSSAYYVLHAGFSLGLLFDPAAGNDILFRNAGWISTGYTALYSST
jgi:hypothetical protein